MLVIYNSFHRRQQYFGSFHFHLTAEALMWCFIWSIWLLVIEFLVPLLRNLNSRVETQQQRRKVLPLSVHRAKHIVKQHYTNGLSLNSFHITIVKTTVLSHKRLAVRSTDVTFVRLK